MNSLCECSEGSFLTVASSLSLCGLAQRATPAPALDDSPIVAERKTLSASVFESVALQTCLGEGGAFWFASGSNSFWLKL